MLDPTQAFRVAESSQIGPIVRAAVDRASRLGFDRAGVTSIAAVTTELARILAGEALHGRLLIGTLAESGNEGLELLALGRGAGMGDAAARLCQRSGARSVEDHGAVARLADAHEIYSTAAYGTALLARFRIRPADAEAAPARFEVGGVSVPMAGESMNGDCWCVENANGRAVLMLADGLGHGPAAHEAASAAVETTRAHHHLTPGAIASRIHEVLRSTRGAAIAVAEIDASMRTLTYCGVGNIAGMIVTRLDSSGLVSRYGTAGQGVIPIQEFTYPFPADALLVLHTDGLKAGWNLNRFPGLAARAPGIVAAVLYGDFDLGRDDTTVIGLRYGQVPSRPSGSTI